jgi:hypothetical protein
MAETMDKEFELWYNQSNLQYGADKKGLTKLYFKIVLGE